jgi:hypothetical protein
MKDITRDFILEGLSRYGLADLPGRPYDSAFELLASPPIRKRLIVMGLNGSSADSLMTNSQSIIHDHSQPLVSNVQLGTQGKWGITHLAKRLKQMPTSLGYRWQDTVYTNALMTCSTNALTLKQEASRHKLTVEQLVKNSTRFFENVTVPLCMPELIIAYSNSLQSLSAASILLENFGDPSTLIYTQNKGYYTTFAFVASINDTKIPVICIRHMSRFKPSDKLVETALKVMRAHQFDL